MTLGGLGVLDSPNSSGWPPMVCQGWGPMDQLSKSKTNNFLQAKYPTPQMPLPARPWFFQRVQNQDPNNTGPLSPCLLQTRQENHLEEASLLYYLHYVSYLFNWTMQEMTKTISTSTPLSKTTTRPLSSCLLKETRKTPFRGRVIFTQFLYLSALLCYLYYVSYLFQLEHAGQTQDLPKIHLSTSTPPSKTTTGPLSSCLLKEARKNTIWRKGSSDYLTTCTLSLTFSTRPCRTNPRLAKDSPLNFPPPPLQNNHGSFVILSSERNQKNTIWRKGSSHYLTTCTMSPSFSTRPCRTNPRLAKDSPLNFPPPPLQNNHGSFVILSSERNQKKNTIWSTGNFHSVSLSVCTTLLPVLRLLPFSTGACRKSLRLAKDSHLVLSFQWNM